MKIVRCTVLRFFFNITRREQAVRSLLCRQCSLSADHTYVEKERFMLDNLKIPAEWIHEAKVGRAVFRTNVYIHSFFLIIYAMSVPSRVAKFIPKA